MLLVQPALQRAARQARDLAREDLQGATFSVSNQGGLGGTLFTPIINPPQSGILGMHNIVERPVAVNGQVEIRPMMYLALSYDHRVIDGAEGVRFTSYLSNLLGDIRRLIL